MSTPDVGCLLHELDRVKGPILVVIGVTIVLEGAHHHLPKTYVYLPLGFCLLVELLQMRQSKRSKQH